MAAPRFGTLNVLHKVLRAIGWAGFALFSFVLAYGYARESTYVSGLGLQGVLVSLGIALSGEFAGVALVIEQNTRASADALVEILALTRSSGRPPPIPPRT